MYIHGVGHFERPNTRRLLTTARETKHHKYQTKIQTITMSITAMNESLRTLGGVAATDYMVGTVAWNDGQRGVVNGKLSAFGGNITDARILARSGKHLNFLRPHNMNEKLGITNAENIVFAERDGSKVTAQTVLETLSKRSEYMGYTSVDAKVSKNQKIVYRVQNAWIPLEEGQTEEDIVPAHYSYQTMSRDDPRNLIVLGTAQGVFVHSDGEGVQKLFAHETTNDGAATEHWFKAEPTTTRVGHSVLNDNETRTKRARAVEMGIRGMGARANCFVVMSIPNTQKPPVLRGGLSSSSWQLSGDDDEKHFSAYRSLSVAGVSRSARVSVAEEVVGTASANPIAIQRPEDEPIVCTILLYNTIEVPKGALKGTNVIVDTSDVALAVSDMEHIYDLAREYGGDVCKLSELPAMLHKLTKADMDVINEKIAKDPPMDPMVPNKKALEMVSSMA